MDKSELKMRYNPEIDRYVKTHIYTKEMYGDGLMDIFKSIRNKLFNKSAKRIAKKAANQAAVSVATKAGEHLGNRAGDQIVQLLSQNQPKDISMQQAIQSINHDQPLTDFEIAQRVNQLISGGKIMKRSKFI